MALDHLHETLLDHKAVLENAIRLDLYRYHRYDVPFSLATFYSDTHNVMDIMKCYVRQTDTVVELEDNLVCVIYGNVGYEEAFKASENILYDINNEHPQAKISAGMTSVTVSDLPKDLLHRAMKNLSYATDKEESYVEDDLVIDYLVKNGFQTIA